MNLLAQVTELSGASPTTVLGLLATVVVALVGIIGVAAKWFVSYAERKDVAFAAAQVESAKLNKEAQEALAASLERVEGHWRDERNRIQDRADAREKETIDAFRELMAKLNG